MHGFGLANPVAAVLRLQITLRVEVGVVVDDRIRSGQVDAQPAGALPIRMFQKVNPRSSLRAAKDVTVEIRYTKRSEPGALYRAMSIFR